MKKSKKKYKVIVKIGNDDFKKWNVNNLVKFTSFLDRQFSDWRWYNVYQYTKDGTGKQLANFTKNKRPRFAYVQE